MPVEISETGRRVIAIFIFAICFWSSEVIALYATSLWIVLLLSYFFVSPSGAREYELFFSGFSNPLILLFFGGFVLAAAIRKHKVDEYLLFKILHAAGSNSYVIFGTILFMSAFFSMWISNTAAAAMMLALSAPLFETLKAKDPMRNGLPLAIAFGCNIGGMGTPIGTPPNAIVLGILREYGTDVSFLGWMLMAVPLVIIILIFVYFLLIFLFPPTQKQFQNKLDCASHLSLGGEKTAIISLLMIIFWLSSSWHGISETWIALAGVGLFASFKLIGIEDLKNINWDVLILMWGGLALGTGIEKGEVLSSYLPHLNGHDEFIVISMFCVAALFISTFISNTATANLILPLAVSIAMVDTKLIAIPVALSCSLAMILPVSTPPNALAFSHGSLTVGQMSRA